MRFFAIDVETACLDQFSICQVGIVAFVDWQVIWSERRFIHPDTPFLARNTDLHGITQEDVADAPTWIEFYPELRRLISNKTIVSHTYFDREASMGACKRYQLCMFPYIRWLDTCAIARKTWPHLPDYKLATLARHFGIAYRAHDGAEDARVAGEILLLAQLAIGKKC